MSTSNQRIDISMGFLARSEFDAKAMEEWLQKEVKAYCTHIQSITAPEPGMLSPCSIQAYSYYPDRKFAGSYIKSIITQFKKLSKRFEGQLFLHLDISVRLY